MRLTIGDQTFPLKAIEAVYIESASSRVWWGWPAVALLTTAGAAIPSRLAIVFAFVFLVSGVAALYVVSRRLPRTHKLLFLIDDEECTAYTTKSVDEIERLGKKVASRIGQEPPEIPKVPISIPVKGIGDFVALLWMSRCFMVGVDKLLS